ncbi:MAG: NAD(P)H-hydrate dehydratase [Acidobacteriota bacterium]
MKILTAHQMRNIDRRAVSRYHIPGLVLMENAGRSVVEHLLETVEDLEEASIAVVCGKGNNGGDGLVVARHLHDLGLTPTVFLVAAPGEIEGGAGTNLRILKSLPVPIRRVADSRAWHAGGDGENPLLSFDVVVDALLGTGLKGRVRGDYQTIVNDISAAGAYVVAVDIPSGLSGDSHLVQGAAVRAHATVTFVAPKVPHLLPPAEAFCGELVVARIGIPDEAVEDEGVYLEWVDEESLEGRLLPREESSHKGDYGHVLIIGGSVGKSGAVRLAAEATLKAGAGRVTAAVPCSVRAEVAAYAPAMTEPLAETGQGQISRRAVTPLRHLAESATLLAVGMGAGTGKETQATLRSLVTGARIPVILDADGLNAFAGREELLSGQDRLLILTPHPGEMARLAGLSSQEVQKDRVGICRSFAINHACYLVLKGYRTLVGTPEGQVYVNPTGNPGLATAGSGDALTGVLSGLVATGLPATDALILGAFAHGLAADLAAEQTGLAALTSATLLEFLPRALRQVEKMSA